jgi:hypothetical protein
MAQEALSRASITALVQEKLYDPKILDRLEAYVDLQAKSGEHDFVTNRHILKLYSLHPDLIKPDIVAKILLKALMELPNTHFLAASYLVREKMLVEESVKAVMRLAPLLETCSFKQFWAEAGQCRPLLDSITGFDGAIRAFISVTVELTYQSLPAASLRDYLSLADRAEFVAFSESRGWIEKDGIIQLRISPENSVNPREDAPLESLSLDSMTKLLATFTHIQ